MHRFLAKTAGLPKILLEVAARTDFTAKFTHISERESLIADETVSVEGLLDMCAFAPPSAMRVPHLLQQNRCLQVGTELAGFNQGAPRNFSRSFGSGGIRLDVAKDTMKTLKVKGRRQDSARL